MATAKEKRDAKLNQQATETGAGAPTIAAPAVHSAKKKSAAAKPPGKSKNKAAPTHEQIEALNQSAIVHPDKVASAHGEIVKPAGSSQKVTVACKIGVGYFNLQLCKMQEKFEQNPQGGRVVKESVRTGNVVQLRGTAYPAGVVPKGFPDRPEIVHGAALNHGIDEDFMDAWSEQNKLNPIVMNQLVFYHRDPSHVRAKAAELTSQRSGLEPIDPSNDKRITRSTNAGVENVQPGQR
jgi:hypothetical protein